MIIIGQFLYLANNNVSNIRVLCYDTDIIVLLLYYYATLKMTCCVTMQSTSSKGAFGDIKATSGKHSKFVSSLLGAHALSGCDSVSYIYNIGKVTIPKLLKAGQRLQHLGDTMASVDDIETEVTKFVASCYGVNTAKNMSDARFQVWLKKMSKPKIISAPELKSLPSTNFAFQEHVLRAHYQTCIWKSASQEGPPPMDPLKYSWKRDELSKLLVPHVEVQMPRCGCATQPICSTGRCSCSAAGISCTTFCNCYGELQCNNVNTKVEDESDDDSDDDN